MAIALERQERLEAHATAAQETLNTKWKNTETKLIKDEQKRRAEEHTKALEHAGTDRICRTD